MIIGIDGNEANVEKKVGISEFAYQLLWQFAKSKANNFKFNVYLKRGPNEDLPPNSQDWEYTIVKPEKLWTQVGLPLELFLKKPRVDVFFSITHYAPRFCPVPSVISIMDLAYLFYPEMFKKNDLYQLINWTAYSVRQAKKIITISTSTKNDIIKEYKVEANKIEVVYPGIKSVAPTIELEKVKKMNQILEEKYKVKKDYILFVGTLQPRKNIERLVEAFCKISKEGKYSDLSLVLVGKKGWHYEDILGAPERLGIKEKVHFLEYVADQDLSLFYKNAECFVLPSLYEGFGLPVLEAMKYGCPVVTSNISSLPEAGGEAALYCDPYNVDDIAEKIKEVLESPSKKKSMIEKGYKQVEKFSWEKSAKKVLSVLEEVGRLS